MITLDEAVELVQWLEMALAPRHFHCALTGSTLYEGKSNNDVDIIVYAHNERASLVPMDAYPVLKKLFPSLYRLDNPEYPQDRLIFRSNADYGIKIDFFILIDVGFDKREDPRWNPQGR